MGSVDQSTLPWRVLWLLPYVPPAGPVPSATQALDPAELRSEGLLLSLEEQLGALTLSELQNSEPSSTVSLNGERFQVELFEDTRESTKVLSSCHFHSSSSPIGPSGSSHLTAELQRFRSSQSNSLPSLKLLFYFMNNTEVPWWASRAGFGPSGHRGRPPFKDYWERSRSGMCWRQGLSESSLFRESFTGKQPELGPRARVMGLSTEHSALLKASTCEHCHLRSLLSS